MTDDLLEENSFTLPAGYQPLNWFSGFGRQIGPLYERIEADGRYTRAFVVQEHHTNGMGNCHGGMLMAFADMAFGHAI
ncbi:MAG: PaaI family thioesterase, partial [Alphaproteobacteria bacterium]|nr:PaaI family thioesterase [Alphaproteobacteria bacterium]MDX5417062.1 PaaI family thioesterase [Alphaproteobacteria bacterium]MDX5494467.1 PaaI family thioesterase [Alphaproteobacteria bacterium]